MKLRLWFTFLMSLVLTFFMTGYVTWLNLGFSELYLEKWFRAFCMAWPAAGVISFIFGPVVQRLSTRLAGQA
ncbi:DUF2798 domain-containing protein [Marinobacterium sediminicola]|uniref:DUF2798 domain-containing protein n=1 Tax=Marinobacterium sediminicola TaxID=518898 RepID=A0ABY1RYV0_9GAMM|nr:DUF2798 domain-containing protein [Marinobacterium sediminicola]ULG68101.1 DUF2798 domain-containing protein [Marinobacterium sediminicola]SMR73387.1 Protein of unknown function [Marinobacterium sediminicola]